MQTQIENIVEKAVLDKMQAQENFTALDISNLLKRDRYPVRHREVAEVIREIYSTGAMAFYGYDRTLIDVTAGDGQQTQAYLYHHFTAAPTLYFARDQVALPPVPAHQARDLSDTVAASPLGLLPRRRHPNGTIRARQRSRQGRRDGALAIPRKMVESLGWGEGDALTVQAQAGKLVIGTGGASSDRVVRVWGGLRVRVSRMNLNLAALIAGQVTLSQHGASLHVEAQGTLFQTLPQGPTASTS